MPKTAAVKKKGSKNAKPRAYTQEEIQHAFLKKVWTLIRYWQTIPNPHGDRMEGFAFSLLSTIDGGGIDLPGFMLVPCPHEEDKSYNIEQGENFFPPPSKAARNAVDISGGCIHELFHLYDVGSSRFDPIRFNAPSLPSVGDPE